MSRRNQSMNNAPRVMTENEDYDEYEQLSSRTRRRKINLDEDEEVDDYKKFTSIQEVRQADKNDDLGEDYSSLGNSAYQSDFQYHLDNDHMLGSVCDNEYKSNILLEKTEEEDIVELEALIKKLNDCYKGSIEASSDSDYTEILMSYFKTNIRLSALMLNSKGTNNIKFKKLIMTSTTGTNSQVNVKRSLSISSINEVDLRKIMSSILTSPHQRLKEPEQNTLLRSEIMTSNNLKTLISENIEADETIKILLTGEMACRTAFIRALRMFDRNFSKPLSEDEILGE